MNAMQNAYPLFPWKSCIFFIIIMSVERRLFDSILDNEIFMIIYSWFKGRVIRISSNFIDRFIYDCFQCSSKTQVYFTSE